MIEPKKVKFKDRELWFMENDDGTGALAPLDHCDQNGNIASWEIALTADSYAHVCQDGKIRRYHEVIGDKADLIPSPLN